MLEFLTLKPESFGLDISDLSLKIIKLKKRRGFLTLSSFLETAIPPGIIQGGEIKDETSLSKIIKEACSKVKGEKLKTNYVIASLPEEKSFLQVIQMPKIPEHDLKSAVIYEAENYIPLAIEEVYLDSQIVKPLFNHLDHYDVLIAALPKKTVDPYLSCFKNAGLMPKTLEIESLAIARALIKNEIAPFPTLLIDIGATRTSFIIFSGYSLRFTCSIPVSSQKFNEAISKTLNIDLKGAEELKIKYGLEGSKKIILKERNGDSKFEKEIIEDKKIFEALVPALTDLTEQIKKYLNYYQTHTSHEHLSVERSEEWRRTNVLRAADGKGVQKIFLSGGGTNLKGLVDFLSSEFKTPVEIGNPWINILPEPLKEVPQLSFEESLKYTTALGLAIRGIKE